MPTTEEIVIALKNKLADKRKQFEAQHMAEEQAITVLEQMLNTEFEDLGVPEVATTRTLPDEIRDVIQPFGTHEFTVPHVEIALRKVGKLPSSKAPRASIAMAMTKLEKDGDVRRTAKPTGSKPHVFKLINRAQEELWEPN